MSNFLKVVIFGLILIGVFTLFAVRYAPSPRRHEEERAVDISAMTGAQIIAFGENIFHGKGTCTLCHDPLGARAPVLKDIFTVASGRVMEPHYRGLAKDARGYLYESLVNPSAYVVKGYGVAGSNDTVSPMPDVRTPAIGMNEAEINALVSFLESGSPASRQDAQPSGRASREGAATR